MCETISTKKCFMGETILVKKCFMSETILSKTQLLVNVNYK